MLLHTPSLDPSSFGDPVPLLGVTIHTGKLSLEKRQNKEVQ